MLLLYILGEHERAEDDRALLAPKYHLDGAPTFAMLFCYFINGMNCFAMQRANPHQSSHYRKLILSYTKKLASLSHSPMTQHMTLLLEAERLALEYQRSCNSSSKVRSTSAVQTVVKSYEEGIEKAIEGGFYVSTAIGYERAGEFLLSVVDNSNRGEEYLKKAYQGYLDYGATVKLQLLKKKWNGKVDFTNIGGYSDWVLRTKVGEKHF